MLKADRIGLVIVVASLLVITAIVWLLFGNQRDSEIADIRTQGVSLARAISGVPYDQLAPGGKQQGVLQALLSALLIELLELIVETAHLLLELFLLLGDLLEFIARLGVIDLLRLAYTFQLTASAIELFLGRGAIRPSVIDSATVRP